MKISNGYSRLQIGLHWLMLLLLAFNWVFSETMSRAYRAAERGLDYTGPAPTVHNWVGFAVLALVALRLVVRFAHGVPPEVEGGPKLLALASRGVYGLLYLLMVLIPVSGIMAWYVGVRQAGEMHEVMVNLLVLLAGLHAAAALFHQYVLKDRLLLRMMRPG